MSENANPFPGDLLASLAANPELLKNAMQMASVLASSGMLNGLFGSGNAPSETQSKPSASPASDASPGGGSVDRGSSSLGSSSGDLSSLLAGLLGGAQGASSGQPKEESRPTPSPASQEKGQGQKKGASPCHNDRVQLLKSVRPFLPEEKRDKIDFLVQLLGLLYSAEQLGIRKLF